MQADHQNGRGRRTQIKGYVLAAQHFDQRVMDNLDDLLAGRDRAHDIFADGTRAHAFHEILDDGKRDIGLQQRHANFAQALIDIGLGQRTAAAKPVECRPKA